MEDLKPELLRKEVIQPHLPIRLPCYDFAPIIELTFDGSLQKVRPPASGTPDFHGVTGGVYKARERIHRCLLISDY
jgi:ribosomal protein L21E